MRFRVVQGTVIIESASLNPRIHSLTMSTPSAELQIETSGLYRLDVLPGQESAVSVYKGKVLWTGAEGRKTQLKSGRRWLLGRFIFFFVEAEVVGPRQGPPKGPDQPLEPAAGTGTCAGERRSLPGKTGFRLPRFRLSEPRGLGSQFQVTMVHLCSLRLLPSLALWIPLHQHPLDSRTRPAGPDNDSRKTQKRIPAWLR